MPEEETRFLSGLPSRSQPLGQGEALFRAGDEARAVFRVEQGGLRLGHGAIAQPGALVAEDALFLPAYPYDAIAAIPSRVTLFPKAAVVLHLSAHPRIALAFAAYLAGQVRTLRGRLEITRLKSAPDRVVAYLAQRGAVGQVIRLEGSLMAVAEEIGLTHEALYRALATLTKNGRLVRPDRRSFRLV